MDIGFCKVIHLCVKVYFVALIVSCFVCLACSIGLRTTPLLLPEVKVVQKSEGDIALEGVFDSSYAHKERKGFWRREEITVSAQKISEIEKLSEFKKIQNGFQIKNNYCSVIYGTGVDLMSDTNKEIKYKFSLEDALKIYNDFEEQGGLENKTEKKVVILEGVRTAIPRFFRNLIFYSLFVTLFGVGVMSLFILQTCLFPSLDEKFFPKLIDIIFMSFFGLSGVGVMFAIFFAVIYALESAVMAW